jgi:hypothetical protein
MSGCNAGYICQGGKTYPVSWTVSPSGSVFAITALDNSGSAFDPRTTGGGSWEWGACAVSKRHTYDWAQVIPAGGQLFTHNLGLSGYTTLGAGNVSVRNAATGAEISVRVTQFTANSFFITVTNATPQAIITFTGSDK